MACTHDTPFSSIIKLILSHYLFPLFLLKFPTHNHFIPCIFNCHLLFYNLRTQSMIYLNHNNKMRVQDLDEQAIFDQFTEIRKDQIKEQGIKFQYSNSVFQVLRSGFFSFRAAQEKLNELRGQKYCLAVYSTNGTLIWNVQPFDIRIRDEADGIFAIESTKLQSKIYNGYSYYLAIFRRASDLTFRLALSNELARFEPRRYNCQVLDFIKGRIDELEMEQVYNFESQGLLNNRFQERIIRESGKNRIFIIEGAAGVGKSLVSTVIAVKYAEIGKKVLLTAVTKQASKAITEHMISSLSYPISRHHDHQMHYQFLKYLKAVVKVKSMISKPAKQTEIINILDRQIKTIIKRTINEKINFLFFNLLLTIQEYFTIQPFIRFYTFNTQLIINLVKVTEYKVNVLEILTVLNKIANIKVVDAVWKKRYEQAVRITIRNADVIVTHTGLVGEINKVQQPSERFQPYLAVFDEAGQATLQNAFSIFNLQIQNLILVGDEKQFKPHFNTPQVLKKTLFTLIKDSNDVPMYRLSDQFRMNKEISDLVAFVSYHQGEMKYVDRGHEHISSHDFFCENPLFMITHNNQEQIPTEHEDGFYNESEIKLIKLYIDKFRDDQLQNVGIVTFFRAQVRRLKKQFAQEVKMGLSISTVEGYQGSSKDYILFSVVRSNERRQLGAAQNRNGVNVALSRARKGLIIFGDINTLYYAPNYSNPWIDVIAYLGNKGRIYWSSDELDQLAESAFTTKKQRDITKQYEFGREFDEQEDISDRYINLEQAKALCDEIKDETVQLPFIERNNN